MNRKINYDPDVKLRASLHVLIRARVLELSMVSGLPIFMGLRLGFPSGRGFTATGKHKDYGAHPGTLAGGTKLHCHIQFVSSLPSA